MAQEALRVLLIIQTPVQSLRRMSRPKCFSVRNFLTTKSEVLKSLFLPLTFFSLIIYSMDSSPFHSTPKEGVIFQRRLFIIRIYKFFETECTYLADEREDLELGEKSCPYGESKADLQCSAPWRKDIAVRAAHHHVEVRSNLGGYRETRGTWRSRTDAARLI